MAIGYNYIDNPDYTWEEENGDGGEIDYLADLVVEGNVGIGTTNPLTKLEITGTHSGSAVNLLTLRTTGSVVSTDTGIQFVEGVNTKVGGIRLIDEGGTTRMAFDTFSNNDVLNIKAGNVGIGTTAPVSKLDLGNNYSDPGTYPNKITLWHGSENNYFGFGISSGDLDYFSQGNHRFYTGYNGTPGTEKFTISGNGNVGIGTTSPSYTLHVNGTFYYSGSSIRYKENIRPLEVDSDKVYLLNPISFDFKNDYKNFGKKLAGGRQIGLIAEDVAKVVPELAVISDGRVSNVDYEKLSVLLLKALKELKTQNEMLELRIRALEAKISETGR
ncbi:MAG: tail fiber domain-containing protein [Candidatus Omnitrophota bacterium]|jgi:hypothetical protein